MLIAREGEEIVSSKGSAWGRLTGDATSSAADQGYLCACCGRPVAVREPVRWRIHLRRGWVR